MGESFIAAFNDYAFDEYLAHYGVGWDDNPPGPGSGRYPHGSGDNPDQHEVSLAKMKSDALKRGISESDFAKGMGYQSTAELRAAITMEKERRMARFVKCIPDAKEEGLSIREIAAKFDVSQSTVRNYLNEDRVIRTDRSRNVANLLKDELKTKHVIDIGPGVEIGNDIGSRERLKTAVEMLKAEGYTQELIKVAQVGNPGQFTTVSVLANPGQM